MNMITWQDDSFPDGRSGIRLIRQGAGWATAPDAAWTGAGDVPPDRILPTGP